MTINKNNFVRREGSHPAPAKQQRVRARCWNPNGKCGISIPWRKGKPTPKACPNCGFDSIAYLKEMAQAKMVKQDPEQV